MERSELLSSSAMVPIDQQVRMAQEAPPQNGLKICIAYASPEYVHVAFVTSLILLMQHVFLKGINAALAGFQGSRITVNRNALVEMALQANCTHILFIDADMKFSPDVLERLLDHDKDFVCATACKRDGSGSALGQFMVGDENTTKAVVQGGLIEAALIGLPLALIKLDVFKKLTKPYFAEPPLGEFPDGEDLYFCRNVRAAGYQIWCDIDISKQLGHIGSKVYYIDRAEDGA